MIYFHITPYSRIKSIARQGLLISSKPTMRLTDDTSGKIFLDENISNILTQIHQGEMKGRRKRNWTVLIVNLPDSFTQYCDSAGYMYVRENIPSDCIKIYKTIKYPEGFCGRWIAKYTNLSKKIREAVILDSKLLSPERVPPGRA